MSYHTWTSPKVQLRPAMGTALPRGLGFPIPKVVRNRPPSGRLDASRISARPPHPPTAPLARLNTSATRRLEFLSCSPTEGAIQFAGTAQLAGLPLI
jgi:hypothetical protein